MCPACIGTLLLVLGSAGSAGGITAVSLRSVRQWKKRSPTPNGERQRDSTGARALPVGHADTGRPGAR